mgnify:CR=1 FL=1
MNKADLLHSINEEQRVFVFKSGGGGFSCWGFQNALDEVFCLQTRLGEPVVEFALGDPAVLKESDRLVSILDKSPVRMSTWFNRHTCPEVKTALDAARNQGTKVRLWVGDTKTGLAWLEENDVYGRIGRSMGPMRVPLLIEDGVGFGGGAILDHCIVRIDGWKGSHNWTIYKHPLWHLPEMSIKDNADSETMKKYPVVVEVGGEVQARFVSQAKAQQYVDFHHGKVRKL